MDVFGLNYIYIYNIYIYISIYTLWLFNIAMENGSFIDGLPFLNMVDLSMAMLNSQRVYILIYIYI